MKIAILSDIHSNPAALQKCLDDARKKGCEEFICLGDIVGYGYDPNTCIDICKSEGIECIMGNHDAAVVGKLGLDWFNEVARAGIKRQIPIVPKDKKEWLASLSYKMTLETDSKMKLGFAHGSLNNPREFGYITCMGEVHGELAYMASKGYDASIVGHSHYANVYVEDKLYDFLERDLEDNLVTDFNKGKCIVNVGSVGYPRNQPVSVYCIYDTDENKMTHHVLDFDFEDYKRQLRLAKIEIPWWLDKRAEQAARIKAQEKMLV